MTVAGNRTAVVGLAGAAALTLIWSKPRAAAAVLLVMSAPLTRSFVLPFSVAGVRSDAFELLAYSTIGIWLLRVAFRRAGVDTYFGLPIAILLVGATVGAVHGVLRGSDPGLVLGQFKSYLIYLLVFPLASWFRTEQERAWLARCVIEVCTAGSLFVVGSIAAGSEIASEAPNVALNTLGVTVQVNRVRPALLWLLFLATLLVVAELQARGMTRLRLARLALFSAVWAFSFNRSSWIALIVCLIVLTLVRPGPRHPGRALRTLTVLAVVAPTMLLAAGSGLLGPSLAQLPPRLESAISPRVTADSSVQDRADEYPVAFKALSRDPVFGVGLATPYGARRPYYDPVLMLVRFEDRIYSHNSLLFLYLQTGVIGLAALVVLAYRCVLVALRARRDAGVGNNLYASVGTVAILGYGVQSLTQTSLLHRPGITAVCVALVLASPVPRSKRVKS